MSKDIFVIVEQRGGVVQKVSYELIGEATKLAADLGEQVVAVLLGHNIKDRAQALIAYGASKVLVVDHPVLADYTTEPYVKALEYIIKNYDPNIVLFGASSIGRDIAPPGRPCSHGSDGGLHAPGRGREEVSGVSAHLHFAGASA